MTTRQQPATNTERAVLDQLFKHHTRIRWLERELRDERRRRNRMIVNAVALGMTYRALGAVAGLSSAAISYIVAAHVCQDCERCTWNPGPDCGKAEHPHCPACGHCEGRHRQPPVPVEQLVGIYAADGDPRGSVAWVRDQRSRRQP